MPSPRDTAAALRRRTLAFRVSRDLPTLLLLIGWSRLPLGPPRALRLRPLKPHPFRLRPGRDRLDMLVDACLRRYHLPPGEIGRARCIWDLGANLGFTAAELAHRHPEAQVVAVEADPATCALARMNLAPLAPRVTVLCGAIWPGHGTVDLAVDPTDSQVAAVGGAHPHRVEVRALHPADLPVGPDGTVDYVKMDIEGAERALFADPTAGAWLARVRVLKVEVHAPYTTGQCEDDLRRHGLATRRDDRHWATVIGIRPH